MNTRKDLGTACVADASAVLVKVVGQDPQLAKASAAPFFQARNGVTELSTSGTPIIVSALKLLSSAVRAGPTNQ